MAIKGSSENQNVLMGDVARAVDGQGEALQGLTVVERHRLEVVEEGLRTIGGLVRRLVSAVEAQSSQIAAAQSSQPRSKTADAAIEELTRRLSSDQDTVRRFEEKVASEVVDVAAAALSSAGKAAGTVDEETARQIASDGREELRRTSEETVKAVAEMAQSNREAVSRLVMAAERGAGGEELARLLSATSERKGEGRQAGPGDLGPATEETEREILRRVASIDSRGEDEVKERRSRREVAESRREEPSEGGGGGGLPDAAKKKAAEAAEDVVNSVKEKLTPFLPAFFKSLVGLVPSAVLGASLLSSWRKSKDAKKAVDESSNSLVGGLGSQADKDGNIDLDVAQMIRRYFMLRDGSLVDNASATLNWAYQGAFVTPYNWAAALMNLNNKSPAARLLGRQAVGQGLLAAVPAGLALSAKALGAKALAGTLMHGSGYMLSTPVTAALAALSATMMHAELSGEMLENVERVEGSLQRFEAQSEDSWRNYNVGSDGKSLGRLLTEHERQLKERLEQIEARMAYPLSGEAPSGLKALKDSVESQIDQAGKARLNYVRNSMIHSLGRAAAVLIRGLMDKVTDVGSMSSAWVEAGGNGLKERVRRIYDVYSDFVTRSAGISNLDDLMKAYHDAVERMDTEGYRYMRFRRAGGKDSRMRDYEWSTTDVARNFWAAAGLVDQKHAALMLASSQPLNPDKAGFHRDISDAVQGTSLSMFATHPLLGYGIVNKEVARHFGIPERKWGRISRGTGTPESLVTSLAANSSLYKDKRNLVKDAGYVALSSMEQVGDPVRNILSLSYDPDKGMFKAFGMPYVFPGGPEKAARLYRRAKEGGVEYNLGNNVVIYYGQNGITIGETNVKAPH